MPCPAGLTVSVDRAIVSVDLFENKLFLSLDLRLWSTVSKLNDLFPAGCCNPEAQQRQHRRDHPQPHLQRAADRVVQGRIRAQQDEASVCCQAVRCATKRLDGLVKL